MVEPTEQCGRLFNALAWITGLRGGSDLGLILEFVVCA